MKGERWKVEGGRWKVEVKMGGMDKLVCPCSIFTKLFLSEP